MRSLPDVGCMSHENSCISTCAKTFFMQESSCMYAVHRMVKIYIVLILNRKDHKCYGVIFIVVTLVLGVYLHPMLGKILSGANPEFTRSAGRYFSSPWRRYTPKTGVKDFITLCKISFLCKNPFSALSLYQITSRCSAACLRQNITHEMYKMH